MNSTQEIPKERLLTALENLVKEGRVIEIPSTETLAEKWLMAGDIWKDVQSSIHKIVEEYHADFPLREGIKRYDLANTLDFGKKESKAILEYLISNRVLVEDKHVLKMHSHEVQLNSEQKTKIDQLNEMFGNNGNQSPSVNDCIEIVGEEIYQMLINNGQIVELSATVVYSSGQLEKLIESTREVLASGKRITVAEYRDHFHITRKYAVALLEYMDAIKITSREGDYRVLLSG